MWRDKLVEIKKEKGVSTKTIAERSGLTVETVHRILNGKRDDKDSPRLNTIMDVCEALGIEVWEIFYFGDKSFLDLQTEISVLKNERDELLAVNAIQNDKIETMRNRVDELKDQIIDVHNYYIKRDRG
jgi:transcriptional regulator with XRE-family HTH domain